MVGIWLDGRVGRVGEWGIEAMVGWMDEWTGVRCF